ncbi:MAG: hypothetical protein QM741_09610 [Rudaea sp.]|uniref:hypothetical protein n=1 Tax=Rudaea sp. TaxID=2136325 RepID=UPI0039E36A60
MKKYTKMPAILALGLLGAACSRIPLVARHDNDAAAPAQNPVAQTAPVAAPKPDSAPPPSADATDRHIELRYAFKTAATPERAYAAIVGVARWWDSRHTYSGNASNLSLDAHAGGCWCEQLADGGSVQHMTVLGAMPGRMLRLSGGLGPLQAAPVVAVMTWTIKRDGNGSEVAMSYLVDGYFPGGLDKVRGDVDAVLAHQVERLRAYVDEN